MIAGTNEGGTAMTRSEIEACVRSIYAARQAGDCDGVMGHLCEGCAYEMMGDDGASPVPGRHEGPMVRSAMEALVAAFPVLDLRLEGLIVDGNRAAVEVVARLRFGPTGETFDTRWASMFTFRDGRVVEVREYIDTARAAQLMGALPQRG